MSDSSSSSENHTVLGFPRIIEAQVELDEGCHTVKTTSGCDMIFDLAVGLHKVESPVELFGRSFAGL